MTIGLWKGVKKHFMKKLIGKNVSPELPVQAYHYRKVTLSKILDWDRANKEINQQIDDYLKNKKIPIIKCKGFSDYQKIFDYIENFGS